MKKGQGLAVALLLAASGCGGDGTPAPPPPKPSIRVERQEDVHGVKLVIWYDHHPVTRYSQHNYSSPHATFTINEVDELQEYKKQLEFALAQIEQVEQRMNVHEPEENQQE